LLVFRTNSAYDRWWDGRKLWGELTNSCRSLTAHLNGILSVNLNTERTVIANLLTSFPYTLQAHLKLERVPRDYFEALLNQHHSKETIIKYSESNHQPLSIFTDLVQYIQILNSNGHLKTQEIYHFKSELNKLIDVCGGCERIKNTPIPFSYSVFLKKFIFFMLCYFPLFTVYTCHFL
jgi:putative membrane protein